MQTKLNGASGAPFMHVSGEVDVFSARISLKKYQTMVAIANNYVSKFISSIQQPEGNIEVFHSSTLSSSYN